jgi:hypothetical protein
LSKTFSGATAIEAVKMLVLERIVAYVFHNRSWHARIPVSAGFSIRPPRTFRLTDDPDDA